MFDDYFAIFQRFKVMFTPLWCFLDVCPRPVWAVCPADRRPSVRRRPDVQNSKSFDFSKSVPNVPKHVSYVLLWCFEQCSTIISPFSAFWSDFHASLVDFGRLSTSCLSRLSGGQTSVRVRPSVRPPATRRPKIEKFRFFQKCPKCTKTCFLCILMMF